MCRWGGGPIFSICSIWSLTQCHSWNSLPCSHQQTFIIATFYRPPATTISFYSTSSSPEKENTSSNRLGTPLSRGAEKPEGPSALQPTTESVCCHQSWRNSKRYRSKRMVLDRLKIEYSRYHYPGCVCK